MVREENALIELKLEKDMIFKPSLGIEKMRELFIDETLESGHEMWGPDAAQLLGMAVMGCMSASLLFCLTKIKLSLDDLNVKGEISFKKIDGGFTRVDQIKVKLSPKTQDPNVQKRLKQCTRVMKSGNMMFEENCIITASVREGIQVDVDVEL